MSIEAYRTVLKRFFGRDADDPVAVYVFGSMARGESTAQSDIDIALLYRTPPPRNLDAPQLAFEGELEAACKRGVDLVVLNFASADLCHRVFRDGVLVLDRDPSFRIQFEVKKRGEYLDFLPILRRYRRFPERSVAPKP